MISLAGHHSSVDMFSKWPGMAVCSSREKLQFKKTKLFVSQCGLGTVGRGDFNFPSTCTILHMFLKQDKCGK